ncbi:TetR/AcrR family transcriptional regulator [Streptomyces botrytidirepellens]|uniref:TetR/AcrR family transcriptional regulator n=1 Tax=Streptomyces botrytidirepellens TaxID=2486417 RepID=A0A3M8UCF8_9ACTN|nr:TetR/AcrR family transcriptional regulator [Streptomyces botrytidirepellens]RNG03148.1 TetR/AcrR family transcriptional regulator [Streptomyces botrytidirepellens]
MGHREDLLAGAKRCLLEKGWSRTTARDIVAASGANLASIGYHYGSKDTLMREALFAAMSDWADEVQASLAQDATADGEVTERFASGWSRALELVGKHQAMWRAQLEAVMQAEHDPALREAFDRAQPEARQALVGLFHGIDGREVDEETTRVLGSFSMTLVSGMVVQQALNPGLTPDARDLIEAMRRILGGGPPDPSA